MGDQPRNNWQNMSKSKITVTIRRGNTFMETFPEPLGAKFSRQAFGDNGSRVPGLADIEEVVIEVHEMTRSAFKTKAKRLGVELETGDDKTSVGFEKRILDAEEGVRFSLFLQHVWARLNRREGKRPPILEVFLKWTESLLAQAIDCREADPIQFDAIMHRLKDIRKSYAICLFEYVSWEMLRLVATTNSDPIYYTGKANQTVLEVPATDNAAICQMLAQEGGRITRSFLLQLDGEEGRERLCVRPGESQKLGNYEYKKMHRNKTDHNIFSYLTMAVLAFIPSLIRHIESHQADKSEATQDATNHGVGEDL